MSEDKSQNTQNAENTLQPDVYGALPNQQNNVISLGDLFSKLIDQWKLIAGITFGGTALAVLLALMLPNVYQPSVTVSLPLSGNVAPLATINTLMGGGSGLPAAPQAAFTSYYNLLRSDTVLSDYIHEKKYLKKLYPDSAKPKSGLFASFISGRKVTIEEPTPEKKGDYLANPKRVIFSIDVEDEGVGVELLNGYLEYVNQELIADLQKDAGVIIKNKIEVLNKDVTKQRGLHSQSRILLIQKMEQENTKAIAVLEEKIAAYLKKAGANRATQVANAKEALEMAVSLDIIYPTTLESLAQKSQKGKGASTAITVLDKQSSSLYLQGSKYLTTLIQTLEKRKSDEAYLSEINNLREKIQLIENDQALAALKKREIDDPWISGLAEKLTQIKALRVLSPDFTNLVAYSADASAIITNIKVKPKRKLIVTAGFMLSLFVAMILVFVKSER